MRRTRPNGNTRNRRRLIAQGKRHIHALDWWKYCVGMRSEWYRDDMEMENTVTFSNRLIMLAAGWFLYYHGCDHDHPNCIWSREFLRYVKDHLRVVWEKLVKTNGSNLLVDQSIEGWATLEFYEPLKHNPRRQLTPANYVFLHLNDVYKHRDAGGDMSCFAPRFAVVHNSNRPRPSLE
jgi:hypothetical protein